jgi:hypothetical protein
MLLHQRYSLFLLVGAQKAIEWTINTSINISIIEVIHTVVLFLEMSVGKEP